ncbi:hypothetical protein BGZ80_007510, partial [Entomortierella chlamydospora]
MERNEDALYAIRGYFNCIQRGGVNANGEGPFWLDQCVAMDEKLTQPGLFASINKIRQNVILKAVEHPL